jgi:acyl-coenzyme A thioesterase PaaI-like protein
VLNGGIIGTLLDCHSLWSAWWSLFQRDAQREPWLLTAEYSIKLLRPTPLDRPITLVATSTELGERSASVAGSLTVDGQVCATSTGRFLRAKKPFPLH